MGALALPSPWIPEDDLLLKNAIEAGASLESLAKGAVLFSRRFTIKELQDRWHALLYDPTISTRAAEQMVELERSATNLSSKSSRSKNMHGKRRSESVRRCYYAMRKRICNEPLNQDSLSFLVGPGDDCFMNGADAPVPDNMLGDPMASHFGLDHANFDELSHEFPQIMRGGPPSCGGNGFPIEQHHTFTNHMERNTMAANKAPLGHGMFEGRGIQANAESKDIMCSGYEENTIFNPHCEAPFDHFQYTSPPPAMPDWKTIDSISVPEMPDDISIRGKKIHSRDPFDIPDDSDAGGTSEYEIQRDDFKVPTDGTEGILAAISNSLFDFTGEDDMLMIDGDNLDDLSSLLLDSPKNVIEGRLPSMLEEREPADTDVYIDIPNSTGPEERNDAGGSHMGSDTQMATSSARVNSEFPELCDGVIHCTLNTEDPEIPCNDDIVFPSTSKLKLTSANRRTQSEANNPSLHGKINRGTQSSGKALSTMKREQKQFGELHPASQTRRPDVGLNRAVDERGAKFEILRAETFNGSKSSSNGHGGPNQSSQAVKKEPIELPLSRPLVSVAEKSCQTADFGQPQSAVGGNSQAVETSSAHRNQESHVLESADVMAIEPVVEPLFSDPEDQFSESDAEIPYFSDVESMILDMDLGPEDQDFYCSSEVTKYQHEDVKRAIIRLEQNAHSCMQRAISSHGAFAILYGRNSKHYIKKPEVLLGRATDDVMVDIDLGREGRANKISRRQAIIKMEKDGAFNLKNTGKCSIYMNSKEIFPGQSLGLHSNCLIEIRGMPFIFETNPTRVKQYLYYAAQKHEDKKANIKTAG